MSEIWYTTVNAMLRCALATTELKNCWELWTQNFDQFQTSRNKMQEGMEMAATWTPNNVVIELLANSDASTWTGPNNHVSVRFFLQKSFFFPKHK